MGVLLIGDAGTLERLAQRRRLDFGAVEDCEVSKNALALPRGHGAAAVDRPAAGLSHQWTGHAATLEKWALPHHTRCLKLPRNALGKRSSASPRLPQTSEEQ